jgi:hypothetical protein
VPDTQRIQTPPGSVIVLRLPEAIHAEDGFPFAEELHRQTGLPVVVVDARSSAELSVTTREEQEEALTDALEDDRLDGTPGGLALAQALLGLLREDGWELIRLRQP